MKNKRKNLILSAVLIVLIIAVYSWFHVEGKEIDLKINNPEWESSLKKL